MFELLDQASPEVVPGLFSHERPGISLSYITNLSQILYHLRHSLEWQIGLLPVVIFYHHSLATVLLITHVDADPPPAVPSCDALEVQLRLTDIYWTSTVCQALCYALGKKQNF